MWVPDPEEGFVPGDIAEEEGDTVEVVLRNGEKVRPITAGPCGRVVCSPGFLGLISWQTRARELDA